MRIQNLDKKYLDSHSQVLHIVELTGQEPVQHPRDRVLEDIRELAPDPSLHVQSALVITVNVEVVSDPTCERVELGQGVGQRPLDTATFLIKRHNVIPWEKDDQGHEHGDLYLVEEGELVMAEMVRSWRRGLDGVSGDDFDFHLGHGHGVPLAVSNS